MKKSLIFALSLLGQIGFAVAIPLIALALTGRYFDKVFHTENKLFFLGIATATIIIFFYLRKIVKKASGNLRDL